MEKINIQEIDTDKILNQYLTASDPKDNAIDRAISSFQLEMIMINDNSTLNESEKEESKRLSENRYKNELTEIQSMKFWIPPTAFEKEMIEWHININVEMNKNKTDHAIKSIPLSRKTVLSKELDNLFTYSFDNLKDIHEDIIKGIYIQDFNKLTNYIGLIRFAQYLDEEIKKENKIVSPESENPIKIKWIGKVAHLGYIIGQLADLGYIDAPKKKSGDISYNEFARQITKVFDFEGNNVATLAKMLSENGNTMETHNRDKIQIPHIKDICSECDINK